MKRKDPFAGTEAMRAVETSDTEQIMLPTTVPPGAKAIVVHQEFNPVVKTQISQLEHDLAQIKSIANQAEVDSANASLKKAKALLKNLESERKMMTSVLDDEKNKLISYERSMSEKLVKLIDLINSNIVTWQKAEAKRQAEEAAEIERGKAEKLAKENAEIQRIDTIKSKLLEFEKNVLNAILTSTLQDIDTKAAYLLKFKLPVEIYQEFTNDAEQLKVTLYRKFLDRKTEIGDLAKAEKESAENFATILAAAKAKADQAVEALKARQTEKEQQTAEAQQNVALNIQMESELKLAMQPKIKGAVKRWTFDEGAIDLTILPLKYHTYDKAKIKEAIAAGETDIPGVRIYQDLINVSR
jgi:hypothetical protein